MSVIEVITMIGNVRSGISRCSASHSCSPVMFGIWMSVSSRSGGFSRMASSAFCPFLTICTW